MIPAETLADLATLGLSRDQANAVSRMLRSVEDATRSEGSAAIEARRKNDRERKERQRHGKSRDVTGMDVKERDNSGAYIARADAPVCSNDISNEISKLDNPQSPSGITPTEKSKRAHRLPEDWVLPDDWRDAALRKGLSDSEANRQAERMLNWSRSAKNGAKLDWRRTWLNWIDDAPRANARAGPPPERDYGKGALARLIRNVDESLENERFGQTESEVSGGNVLRIPVVQGVGGRDLDDDGDVSPFAKWLRPGSG